MTIGSEPISSNRALLDSDEDWDDERRTLTQWLVDVALLPALVLFAISLVALGITASLWATLKIVAAILSLIQ